MYIEKNKNIQRVIMRRKIKTKFLWSYDDNMEELYRTMMQRIEFNKVTLQMTQSEYNSFAIATDEEEDFYASNFRPTNDQTDNCNLNWVFAGKLEFKIEIIK